MSHTTTLNELLAAVFLGVSAAGLVAIPALLLAVANAKHTATRLVLITLNVRDRARLAVIDALLVTLRRSNTPKRTLR